MLRDGVDHVGDAAVKQQQADRDRGHAIAHLAEGADANRPSRFAKRALRPPQPDIDGVIAIRIDRANGLDLLPLEIPRHQATIENSALIYAQDNAVIASTPAEALRQKGDAGQPCQAKPCQERNGKRKASRRRSGHGEQDKAGHAELGVAPPEANGVDLGGGLRLLSNTRLSPTWLGSTRHGGPLLAQHPGRDRTNPPRAKQRYSGCTAHA